MTRMHAPAAERNRDAILDVLRKLLAGGGRVLEIASGSGQHAIYFARNLPDVTWQPSDISSDALASIRAWSAGSGADNLLDPLRLDVNADSWPVSDLTAVVCINMLHISPFENCGGLFRGAARATTPDGMVIIYGPFRIRDRPTAPSNETFDDWLKRRDPAWGLRWLHEVEAKARAQGFELDGVTDMPSNNVTAVFRRQS